MINITDIKKGITKTISDALKDYFKSITITDEPISNVEGPSIVINMISADPEPFSLDYVNMNYHFDVIYLAPLNEPALKQDEIAQALTAGFFAPVTFKGRHILPTNISNAKVDKDYHTMFDIAFFDDVVSSRESHYEIMKSLSFRLELTSNTKE